MRPALARLALIAAFAPVLLRAEPPPVALFDGRSLAGWSLVTNPAAPRDAICRLEPNGALAVAGRPLGYLLAPGSYADYRLHVEWRWPVGAAPNSNSGVLVHIASGPIDRHLWPRCFQIQTKVNRGGDLLPMAGATFAEPLSTPPGARTPQLDRRHPPSEKPFGEWNSCDILCRGGSIECRINGVLQNRATGCSPRSGRIAIQLEGAPFEMRNVVLQPLD